MSENREVTDQIAFNSLKKLITDRMRQLNNTPAFLEQERENLKMEIKNYKRHLQKIGEVQG